ncbi:MAG: shikimate kinase [Candidatus Sumerlaeota bacterium]|nr:shikimate kinase [Candidatus Sumerlaeota bacterium]
MAQSPNLILIGMPGVGKSTVGVLLAKAASREFVDIDVWIQSREGRRLQDIIDAVGMEAFRALEERSVLALAVQNAVIATGGSVVYSEAAMRHLKTGGVAIHLDLALPLLEKRLTNLDSRGVVRTPSQSLAELYAERQPLYRRHADVAIDCAGKTHEEVVEEILKIVEDRMRNAECGMRNKV